MDDTRPHDRMEAPLGWRDGLLIILVIAAVSAVGAWSHVDHDVEHAVKRTEALAELAAQQVEAWIDQRGALAGLAIGNAGLAQWFVEGWREGDTASRQILVDRLRALARAGGFDQSALYRGGGELVWSLGPPPTGDLALPAAATTDAAPTLRTERDADGAVHLAFYTRLDVAEEAAPYVRFAAPLADTPLGAVSAAESSVGAELYALHVDGSRALGIRADRDGMRTVRLSGAARERLPLEAGADAAPRRGPDGGGVSWWTARPLATDGWWVLASLSRAHVARSIVAPIVAAWLGLAALAGTALALGIAWLRRRASRSATRARAAHDAQREQERALLAAIVETTSEAILAKDPDGRYLFANRAAGQLLGRHPDDLVGASDDELFARDQAERLRGNDRVVLEEGGTRTFEETVRTPYGVRTFEATKGPLRREDGSIFGSFDVSRDVTELRATQRSLAERHEELARTVEELERFNATMVDREVRMVELKRQLNRAHERLGEPPPYPAVEGSGDSDG